MVLAAIVIIGLLLLGGELTSAQTAISGKLKIKNELPDDEARNKIVLTYKDPSIAIGEAGSSDDPRCGIDPSGTVKATLEVFSTTSGQYALFELPCENWEIIGPSVAPKGYKYKDPELDEGPCKTVLVKGGKLLKAICEGKGPSTLDYDLQESQSQVPVQVHFQSGALLECGTFAVASHDGSDGLRFKAAVTPLPKCEPPVVDSCRLSFVEMQQDEVGGVDGLEGASGIAMDAPSARHLYAGGASESKLAAFKTNKATGRLTFVEVHTDGAGGVDGLSEVQSVTVARDELNVYATGKTDDAVAVFKRNSAKGTLTYLEVQQDFVGPVRGLDGAQGIAASLDGKHVYATGKFDRSVVVFSRNATTGTLTFVEEIQDGMGGVDGLSGAHGIAVTPDGKHVYAVGEFEHAVAVFSRDATTGKLTFVEVQTDGMGGVDGLENARGIALSADGKHVYVTGFVADAVAVFSRDATTGKLTYVEVHKDGVGGVDGLDGAASAAVSADGKCVYVRAGLESKLAVFKRDAATGKLTIDQVLTDGVGTVDGLGGTGTVTVSPGIKYVYVTGSTDNAIAVFARQ